MSGGGSGNSGDEILDSISSEGIQNLESFLQELNATLGAQNEQIEAMNRERQEYLNRISSPNYANTLNNRTNPARSVRSEGVDYPGRAFLARHTPPPGSGPFGLDPSMSSSNLRPSRYQMGREMGPPPINPVAQAQAHARPSRGSGIGADVCRLLNRMGNLVVNHGGGGATPNPSPAGVQLDLATQFGSNSSPSHSQALTNSTATTTTRNHSSGGGGDTVGGGGGLSGPGNGPTFQTRTILAQVIKRAADAAAAAGDSAGHAQLEQFEQDLSNTLQRGVGLMPGIPGTGTHGNGQVGESVLSLLDLGSSSSSSESESGEDEDEEEGEHVGGEESSSELELREWDRGTLLLNDYFQTDEQEEEESDSEEEEEDRLLFFGIFNTPHSPGTNTNPNNTLRNNNTLRGGGGRGENGEGQNAGLGGGRRQATRNISPATVQFYQSLGIRIAKEDEAKLSNGFTNAVILPCPKTLYPDGAPMGSETPEPLSPILPEGELGDGIGEGREVSGSPPLLSLEDLLGSEDEEEENTGNEIKGPLTSEDTEEAFQDSSESINPSTLPSISPVVLDLASEDEEDLELEKLIQDFKRKRLESKEGSAESKANKGTLMTEDPDILPTQATGDGEGGKTAEPCSSSGGGGSVGLGPSQTKAKLEKGMMRKKKPTPPKSAPGGRQGQGHGQRPGPARAQKSTEGVIKGPAQNLPPNRRVHP